MRRVVIFLVLALLTTPIGEVGAAGGARAPKGGGGAVDVLYAGSLLRLMESRLGPAFSEQSGYQFVGFAAGSTELANEVKAGIVTGDVFISASPVTDRALEGAKHGSWVSWYATFAQSPLVLGFEPNTRFARAIRSRPWYDAITEHHFRIGRTDPVLDPKGVLTVEALKETARRTRDRNVLSLLNSDAEVFPEETLLGRLEAGQLDSGFFYLDEARAAGLEIARLTPVALYATYTVTVLARATHQKGALAFVRFLLGRAGRRLMSVGGLDPHAPAAIHGTGVPSSLDSFVSRS